MQSQKILAFSDFLARQPKSYNEIAQFLVMNTFSEEKFLTLHMGELIETGVVCPLGGFGFTAEKSAQIVEVAIHDRSPVTDVIRANQVLINHNNAEFFECYPGLTDFLSDYQWSSAISIPIYPIGGMVLYSSEVHELNSSTEMFYTAIGSLLGLYASRLPVALVEVAINVKQKINLPQIPLSDRQLVIAGMLERGFNNAQIGLELGYSESLVRQETVAIYRKLQVTGRKAMQAISALNLDAQALGEKE